MTRQQKRNSVLAGLAAIISGLVVSHLSHSTSQPKPHAKRAAHVSATIPLPTFKPRALVKTNAMVPNAVVMNAVLAPPSRWIWTWDLPTGNPTIPTHIDAMESVTNNTVRVTWLERTTNLTHRVWVRCTTNVLCATAAQNGGQARAVVTNDLPVFFLRAVYGFIPAP